MNLIKSDKSINNSINLNGLNNTFITIIIEFRPVVGPHLALIVRSKVNGLGNSEKGPRFVRVANKIELFEVTF